MLVTSEDFMQVILPAIQKSYLSSESKNRFVYFKYQAVNNELLLEKVSFNGPCYLNTKKTLKMGHLKAVKVLCGTCPTGPS